MVYSVLDDETADISDHSWSDAEEYRITGN